VAVARQWNDAQLEARLFQWVGDVVGGAMKVDDHALVFKINLAAGHGGASGRYDNLREIAFGYAFILPQLERAG
jgi:protease II